MLRLASATCRFPSLATRFRASASSSKGSSLAIGRLEQFACLEAVAKPGAAGQRGKFSLQKRLRAAQHQLGLQQIARRRLRVEQTDVNAAGAQLERGAAGQEGGANH